MSDFGIFLEYLGYTILIVLVIYILIGIIKCIVNAIKKASLLRVARSKRVSRDKFVKGFQLPIVNLPQNLLEEILNSDVTNLKRLLDARKVTSEQLTLIFLQRSATIGLDLELITEIPFEEALQQARECDRIRATKYANKPVNDNEGLFFGVPISIKDLFEMKGFEINFGCGALCNQPKAEDGYVIRLLRNEGAILFVRSNVPQVGFSFESWNKVYGKAQNPWNRSRTTGGSSGGEAGLVAARCSPMGLGSDMGGSIRAPSTFCGVYGFKPSSKRVSNKGHGHLTDAFDGLSCVVPISIGPLAKSTNDVALMMKALLNERFHMENRFTEGGDSYFTIFPWREQILLDKRPYKIGYMRNNNFMPVATSFTRAIDETVQALKFHGHELVEIEMNFLDVIQSLYYQAVTADANLGVFKDAVQEQGMDNELFRNLKMIIATPQCLKDGVGSLANCLGMPRVAGLMKSTAAKNAHELFELMSHIKSLKEKFMKWWSAYELDALILPNLGMPAFKHGFSGDISVFGAYTFLANLLDLPAGAVPVTVIGESETAYDEVVATNRDMITKKARENMVESEGMPVGVQIITPFMEEERCVAIMKQIEDGIKFYSKYAFPI